MVSTTPDLHFRELDVALHKIDLYMKILRSRITKNDIAKQSDPKLIKDVVLRDYQRVGYQWILTLFENGMNGILADEMGLGKTLQVLASIAAMIESGVTGPFLIIAPLSLIPGWVEQLVAYCPSLSHLVYYGSQETRQKLRKFIRRKGSFVHLNNIDDHSEAFDSGTSSTSNYTPTQSTDTTSTTFSEYSLTLSSPTMDNSNHDCSSSASSNFCSSSTPIQDSTTQKLVNEIDNVEKIDDQMLIENHNNTSVSHIDEIITCVLSDDFPLFEIYRPFILNRRRIVSEKHQSASNHSNNHHIDSCQIDSRSSSRSNEPKHGKNKRSDDKNNGIAIGPIVLTSYEIAIRDERFLRNVDFSMLVVDEGQRLKNPNSRIYKRLAKFSTGLRILLTGTPLQNRISELWSLLHFILPEVFTSLELFEQWFDPVHLLGEQGRDRLAAAETEHLLVSKLHRIIRPFVLRRCKEKSNLLLPPKREILIKVGLTDLQKTLCEQVKKKFLPLYAMDERDQSDSRITRSGTRKRSYEETAVGSDDLVAPGVITRTARRRTVIESRESEPSPPPPPKKEELSGSPSLLSANLSLNNPFMLLRLIVNHPYLAMDSPWQDQLSDGSNHLIMSSEKTIMLERLLNQLLSSGHKVIIFSQFKLLLDIIEEVLDAHQWTFVRLDGSTKLEDRQAAIRSFNNDSSDSPSIFLASTRAGGCGLNLQVAADTVIIFDSDWNPQTDIQAQDRCHRIGQNKPVLVLRLVAMNTIDEVILQRANAKRGLERLVLQTADQSCVLGQERTNSDQPNLYQIDKTCLSQSEMPGLSRDEVMNLLSKLDYSSTVNESTNLSDNDLSKLLDRSDLWKQWDAQKANAQSSSIERTSDQSITDSNIDCVTSLDQSNSPPQSIVVESGPNFEHDSKDNVLEAVAMDIGIRDPTPTTDQSITDSNIDCVTSLDQSNSPPQSIVVESGPNFEHDSKDNVLEAVVMDKGICNHANFNIDVEP